MIVQDVNDTADPGGWSGVYEYGTVRPAPSTSWVPSGSTLEGCYVDDHLAASICHRRDLLSFSGRDYDIIQGSHRAYRLAELERAERSKCEVGRLCHARGR